MNSPPQSPCNPRRALLKRLVAVIAALYTPALPATTPGARQRLRAIPASGERIPAVGLGTARTFDVGQSETARAPLREVLRLFSVQGGRMVDTSPMYGAAETVAGELAAELGLTRQLFWATKVWIQGRDAGRRQMEQSARLLGAPAIDLMQVHNLVDTETQLGTIREWIAAGRIRYVGITHYTSSAFAELERLLRRERLDFVQFPYSITNRAAERRLLAAAADHGVATIAHRNFERGALFARVRGRPLPDWAAEFDCRSWGNFFLKYLLADDRITCVIPATSKPKHLIDNMAAGLGPLPAPSLRAKMVALVESL